MITTNGASVRGAGGIAALGLGLLLLCVPLAGGDAITDTYAVQSCNNGVSMAAGQGGCRGGGRECMQARARSY